MKNFNIFIIFASILITTSGGATALAYVASSTNYIIERDSLNTAGNLSTSTNYGLEDTAGELGTGNSTSTNYNLYAGYQQSDYYIAVSAPSDVSLVPAITTLEGGQADGSAIWTVTTNYPSGYSLSIKAATLPALKSSGSSFANYTPGSDPDYTWSVGSASSEFGFTPSGSDITSTYKDNGVALCAVGALDTALACWDSITTTNKIIASRVSANEPGGTATTVSFRAEAGASASQASGSYSALITVTAVAL